MILSRRAALGGVQLDSVDERILIQAIETGAARSQISTAGRGWGDGSRVTADRRESLDISIRFSINAKSYLPQSRAEVIEKANAWARAGGWLTVSYKPGRRIHVQLAQPAAEGDARSRGSYTIVLRAFGVPYWEEENPQAVQEKSVSSGTYTLGVNGSAATCGEFTFNNTSGSTINTLTVTMDGQSMSFSGLGLASGETLEADHDAEGYLRLRIKATNGTRRSVLNKRAVESADELWLEPGQRRVTFTAGGAGTFKASVRGRFA